MRTTHTFVLRLWMDTDEPNEWRGTLHSGDFQDDALAAYQEVHGQRVPVPVTYALGDDATYGFRLGAYDPTLPLVIDPVVLVYCGFIGGSGDDYAEGKVYLPLVVR